MTIGLLRRSDVSFGSWLCEKSTAQKIGRTNLSSDRNEGNDNSSLSILSDLRNVFSWLWSLRSFYTARVKKCPKRLRLPAGKSPREHTGRIVPKADINKCARQRCASLRRRDFDKPQGPLNDGPGRHIRSGSVSRRRNMCSPLPGRGSHPMFPTGSM
jgi:hypothetical protein